MSIEEPDVIDCVAHDPKGEVVLVMVEGREWDGSDERLFELQERINNYAAFATDGQLIEKYPEFAGKSVRVELRCAGDPDPATSRFLELAKRRLRSAGLSLSVKRIGARPSGWNISTRWWTYLCVALTSRTGNGEHGSRNTAPNMNTNREPRRLKRERQAILATP